MLWSDGDTHVPLTSTSHFRQGWRLSVFSVHADLSRTMALWWLLRFYATAKTCMDYFIVHTRSVRVKPPSYRLPTIHTIHTPAMHRARWKKSILLSHKHGVFQWHCKHTASWSLTYLPPTYMAHCYTGKKTDNAGFFQTCSATFYWLARFYHYCTVTSMHTQPVFVKSRTYHPPECSSNPQSALEKWSHSSPFSQWLFNEASRVLTPAPRCHLQEEEISLY